MSTVSYSDVVVVFVSSALKRTAVDEKKALLASRALFGGSRRHPALCVERVVDGELYRFHEEDPHTGKGAPPDTSVILAGMRSLDTAVREGFVVPVPSDLVSTSKNFVQAVAVPFTYTSMSVSDSVRTDAWTALRRLWDGTDSAYSTKVDIEDVVPVGSLFDPNDSAAIRMVAGRCDEWDDYIKGLTSDSKSRSREDSFDDSPSSSKRPNPAYDAVIGLLYSLGIARTTLLDPEASAQINRIADALSDENSPVYRAATALLRQKFGPGK